MPGEEIPVEASQGVSPGDIAGGAWHGLQRGISPIGGVQAFGDAANVAVSTAGDNIVKTLQSMVVETAMNANSLIMTLWIKTPGANPLTTDYDQALPADPQLIAPLADIQASLLTVTGLFGIVGILVAVARTVIKNRAAELLTVVKMLGNVMAVALAAVVAVWVGIQAADEFSLWLVESTIDGIGDSYAEGEHSLFDSESLLSVGLLTGSFTMLLALLGSLVQVVFMFFRGALLMVLLAVWPTVAAASSTEAGAAAFKRMNGWIIALILYKPAAAVIYSLGYRLMFQGDDEPLMNLAYGVMIILLACLALPALIKFMAPPAGVGASNMFSGGAALASVATGAVTIASFAAGSGIASAGAGAGAAARAGVGRGGGGGTGSSMATSPGKGPSGGGLSEGSGPAGSRGGPSEGTIPAGGEDPGPGHSAGAGPHGDPSPADGEHSASQADRRNSGPAGGRPVSTSQSDGRRGNTSDTSSGQGTDGTGGGAGSTRPVVDGAGTAPKEGGSRPHVSPPAGGGAPGAAGTAAPVRRGPRVTADPASVKPPVGASGGRRAFSRRRLFSIGTMASGARGVSAPLDDERTQ